MATLYVQWSGIVSKASKLQARFNCVGSSQATRTPNFLNDPTAILDDGEIQSIPVDSMSDLHDSQLQSAHIFLNMSNSQTNRPAVKSVYFGYGSNLWKHQMRQRCPESTYIGIGRLPQYKWIISSRGYANVVQTDDAADEVYGLVYTLTASDETKLDRNEGVPISYTKEDLSVEFWNAGDGEKVDPRAPFTVLPMLVYIDRARVTDDIPKEEYVYRMNMGIRDALAAGVPEAYINSVVRKFVPEGNEGEEVQAKAERQALAFRDENYHQI